MSNRIPIPSAFQIFGERIEVKQEPLLADRNDSTGEARYTLNRVLLQRETEGFSRPATQYEQVWLHELTHWILHMIEENDLRSNEQFVQRFSRALHQALASAEYDEP